MRTLLLFAKYIALEESQKKIDLDHVAASFLCLKPFAKDHSAPLFGELQNRFKSVDIGEEFIADRYKNDLSSVLLSYMAEKPVLPFSETAVFFFHAFYQTGCSFSFLMDLWSPDIKIQAKP